VQLIDHRLQWTCNVDRNAAGESDAARGHPLTLLRFAQSGSCLPALVSAPGALPLDVFARSPAEIGRAEDEDLEALRPDLLAATHTGR
jgi:hypothetical protein